MILTQVVLDLITAIFLVAIVKHIVTTVDVDIAPFVLPTWFQVVLVLVLRVSVLVSTLKLTLWHLKMKILSAVVQAIS